MHIHIFMKLIKEYRISGLDCANCAIKIEKAVAKLPFVESAALDFANLKLTAVHSFDQRKA